MLGINPVCSTMIRQIFPMDFIKHGSGFCQLTAFISAFRSHVVYASHQTGSNVPAKHSIFPIIWRRHCHKSLPSGMQRTLARKMASKHTRDSRVRGKNSTANLTGIEKGICVLLWVSISMLNGNLFRKVVTCMESLEDEMLTRDSTASHYIHNKHNRGIISTQKYEFQSIQFKILKEKQEFINNKL